MASLRDLLSNPTTTLSPGTTRATISVAPNMSPQLVGSPVTPTEIPPHPPQFQDNMEASGDDSDDIDNDPVCQVMDILNFTVVPRKPTSILETPLPPGDLMPKSHYIEEKRALIEIIRTHKKDLIQAQADKLTETMKLLETEKKMHQVVKIIAELHNLYGKFVKSLAFLMAKAEGKNGQVLLTIGPFPDVQEVDKLLSMLGSLSNQFENDFENLSQTKRSLREVNEFLGEKVSNKLSVQPLDNQNEVEILEEVEVFRENGVKRSVSAGGSSCSEASTLIIPDEECVSLDNSAAFAQNPCIASPMSLPSNVGVGTNIESPTTSVPPPVPEVSDGTTYFIPVPHSNSLPNGKTMYSLVEYPKQLNLLNKVHGFDPSKGGWYCLCGQSFESVSLLKYHIRYFSAKWKFLCKLCSRKYPGLNFLKLHMLRSHKIMYVGTNGCNFCPKTFQTASELLTHLKHVHQKKLPSEVHHLTSIPVPAAATQSQVNVSLGPDTGGASSVLVVNGSRCACGVETGTRDDLIAHIRAEVEAHGQHFTCSECQEIFNHPCNLKSHFREKHGVEYQDYQERQYGCSSCDAMFGTYEELDSHTATEHRTNQDPLSIDYVVENMMSVSDDNTITLHIETDANCMSENEGLVTSSEPPLITIDDDE